MRTTDFDSAVHEESFLISSFDADFNGNAKLTSICNYLQEIAGKHVDLIHQGLNDLQVKNMAWVLSRLKVHIYEYPKWKDKITIQTWPTGTNGLFGNRDFKIKNESGKTIAIATSAWIIIQMDNKRPVRPNHFADKMTVYNETLVFSNPLQKLKIENNFEFNEKIKIHYSDIDINQHVNNVKYIKWVMDACPIKKLNKDQISELQINFLHESKLTDELIIFGNKTECEPHQFVIKNRKTGIEHCHAIIKWT
ncbi:acyl-[acyl-carrier-protein] thioesterase [Ancylomarina longa]|uniref:Acyl-ACP thioesterase n=1 Tax=Ancylomarina longa TaxID=2487017 RepID=A0A434AF86_9BACT|nr:acyl-ACP thioesterase domain-containing protein [Ancylomarina longa]RUT72985.1 hypothetical protein DLK05_15555 [Ancylomarina longa]